MIHVWLSLEPETRRVSMQPHPFTRSDFPEGRPGDGWPVRQGNIDEKVWSAILTGSLDPDEVDRVHRDLWTEGGQSAWPTA